MYKISLAKAKLPEKGPKPLYYDTFVVYIRNILSHNCIPYRLEGTIAPGASKFILELDSKQILIDFSDHPGDYLSNWKDYDAYFKFHYVEAIHGSCETIYPFAPVSFYNWAEYYTLKKRIEYICNSNLILNMQKPSGAAVARRRLVQKMLTKRYHAHVAIGYTPAQDDYWKKINNCLVHVFVPGARNDMLDRGHLQYLAFGCCTIAPPIIDVLPYNEKLIPNVHYVQCKPDYSDLLDRIEWVKENREGAVEIGKNAKELFERSCEPGKLWNWILGKL